MGYNELLAQLKENAAKTEARRVEANTKLSSAAQQVALQAAQSVPQGRGGNRGGSGRPIPAGKPGNFKAGKVDPYADMVTRKFNGMTYTVNASVDHRFQRFLKALKKQGYVPKSIGGYSDRNIAGTNTKSLHSYGLAIDIDPSGNGVQYGDNFNTTLPKGVGKLASQYGLTWGGDWNGSKKDPMHFSVPYFGTK